MQQNEFSLGQAFTDGFTAFKLNPGLAIGGMLVYMAVTIVLGLIPFVGFLVSLIVVPPMVGGLSLFFLKLTSGVHAEIGDIFSGFNKFGRYLGIYWIMFLIVILFMMPLFVFIGGIAFLAEGNPDAVNPVIIFGVSMILIVGMYIFLMRYFFVFFVAANNCDNDSVIGAFKESARITEGIRLRLFGALIVIGLFTMLGYLALIIGIFVTAPISMCIFASIYLQLQGVDADEMPPEMPLDVDTESSY